VSNCDNDIDVVTKTLENDSMELINWFSLNLMKANPNARSWIFSILIEFFSEQ
jgi:hypothetical protein